MKMYGLTSLFILQSRTVSKFPLLNLPPPPPPPPPSAISIGSWALAPFSHNVLEVHTPVGGIVPLSTQHQGCARLMSRESNLTRL